MKKNEKISESKNDKDSDIDKIISEIRNENTTLQKLVDFLTNEKLKQIKNEVKINQNTNKS